MSAWPSPHFRSWYFPLDAPLFFGAGDLAYYRIKNRGPVGGYDVQVEFSTLYEVTHDFTGE